MPQVRQQHGPADVDRDAAVFEPDREGQHARIGKHELDPLLKMLVDEKFWPKWAWPNKQGIELTVVRGARKIDGNGVMLKVTTIPRGARSQSWFGQPICTITRFRPTFWERTRTAGCPTSGLSGSAHTLLLMGDQQALQIQTWPAPRLPFQAQSSLRLEGDEWYTLKLQASNEEGKVVLRGKVWPRGQKEPEKWLLEAADPSPRPNREGSPGVSGDAKNAEIFFDNILVTRNKSGSGGLVSELQKSGHSTGAR